MLQTVNHEVKIIKKDNGNMKFYVDGEEFSGVVGYEIEAAVNEPEITTLKFFSKTLIVAEEGV